MTTSIVCYLGRPVSHLVEAFPYCDWAYVKSPEAEGAEASEWVYLEFPSQGLELRCNVAEQLTAIFLHPNTNSVERCEEDAFYCLSRSEIRERLGAPLKSGEPSYSPYLGKMGGWDLFGRDKTTIHFEYYLGRDEIKMITLELSTDAERVTQ